MKTAKIPADLHRQIAIQAATEGRPIQELLEELLQEGLNCYRRRIKRQGGKGRQ